MEEDGQETIARKEAFLKYMEDKIDTTNSEYKERFLSVKNQVIENIKSTKSSYNRSRSSSISSQQSTRSKRAISEDTDDVRSTRTKLPDAQPLLLQ